MSDDLTKKVSKMLWNVMEATKANVAQNVIAAARSNEVKLTNEDLQKLIYVVNSSCDQISMSSSKNFETQVVSLMKEATKSTKTK